MATATGRASYVPSKTPQVSGDDASALAYYLEGELHSIAVALQQDPILNIDTVVPPKVQQGLLVYADGTHWDPGAGEGLYLYGASGVWLPLMPRLLFKGHNSSSQANTGTRAVVNIDVADLDPYAAFNTGTHTYTVGQAGLYSISAYVLYGNALGVNIGCGIFQNGALKIEDQGDAAVSNTAMSLSVILDCAAGDTLQTVAFNNSGTGQFNAGSSTAPTMIITRLR